MRSLKKKQGDQIKGEIRSIVGRTTEKISIGEQRRGWQASQGDGVSRALRLEMGKCVLNWTKVEKQQISKKWGGKSTNKRGSRKDCRISIRIGRVLSAIPLLKMKSAHRGRRGGNLEGPKKLTSRKRRGVLGARRRSILLGRVHTPHECQIPFMLRVRSNAMKENNVLMGLNSDGV